MKPSPHARRVRKRIVRAWAPYLAAAMLLWGVEVPLLSASPGPSSPKWPCIATMTPPLLVALYFNFFVGTALFVRAFARRKGRAGVARYLFSEGEGGEPGVIGRALLKAAGARSEAISPP